MLFYFSIFRLYLLLGNQSFVDLIFFFVFDFTLVLATGVFDT